MSRDIGWGLKLAGLFGDNGGGITPLSQLGQNPPFQPASSYQTQLNPLDEMAFRQWVTQNVVPFDVNAQGPQDYDMRGYWRGLTNGSPMARPTDVNQNDGKPHYTDFYKTPLHQSFSSESQWADANAPEWVNDHQLAAPNGRVVFDEQPNAFAVSLANLGK